MKKTPGNIILLHMSSINKDIRCNKCDYLSLRAIFRPFTLPGTQKLWKNEKKNTWRYHFTHAYQVYHKSCLYVWFLRYGAPWTEFFVIFGHFLPFCPTNNPRNQNFEKMKRKPGDTIILHKCTKNHDHLLYTVPEIWHVTHEFFLAFYTPNSLKNQNLTKWKKTGDIITLNMCTKNYDHMMYGSWDMCVTEKWTDGQIDG